MKRAIDIIESNEELWELFPVMERYDLHSVVSKFKLPDMWIILSKIGLKYDATFDYPDKINHPAWIKLYKKL